MNRIFAIALIEWARLLRSPSSVTLLLLVPAVQVILFGTAIRPQSATLTVAIAAPTPQSAAQVAERLRSEADVVTETLRPGKAAGAVAQGRATIGIEVPEVRSFANPFARDMPVRIIVDSSNVALTEATLARIAGAYWRGALERAAPDASIPKLEVERLYNADARTDWAFLPALIGVTVMISMIMLGCLSLAREREGGTWEAVLSLPIGRGALLLGKALPYTLLGALQGLVVLAVAIILFDVPTRGAVTVLCALLPPFAAAHFLFGYALAARAQTQIAALQGAIAFYLPAMLLSGFLYPFESLPRWAQWIGGVFPLTHLIRAARDALLRGRDAMAVAIDGLPILAALFVAAALAGWLHTRRID